MSGLSAIVRRADGAEVLVLPDASAIAVAAADRLVAAARQAIDERHVAHLALTGGSSAAALYRELRSPARRSDLDWAALQLWWGDERYVPLDHRDSSAGVASKLLFEPGLDEEIDRSDALPIPAQNVHPIPVDEAIGHALGAPWAAERYAAMLATSVPPGDAGPAFDVVLLGVGADGHILSVFPGSPVLAADGAAVQAVPAPQHIEPHLERVTLHPRMLGSARRILVMVPGGAKAAVLRDLLGAEDAPERWPAQLALLPTATWLLDEESAAQLT